MPSRRNLLGPKWRRKLWKKHHDWSGSDLHNLLNHLTIDPLESQQTGLNRHLSGGKEGPPNAPTVDLHSMCPYRWAMAGVGPAYVIE